MSTGFRDSNVIFPHSFLTVPVINMWQSHLGYSGLEVSRCLHPPASRLSFVKGKNYEN